MMGGELLEICDVECRIVTMCCSRSSHSVNACTVVVNWVPVVVTGDAGVCSLGSDSSFGQRGVTWSEQGMYRQQRMSKRLASRR